MNGTIFEFVINLKDVKNEHDVIYRFRKALNLFIYASEEAEKKRIETEGDERGYWDSFDDDLTCIPVVDEAVYIRKEKVDYVILYLEHFWDVSTKVSKETSRLLSRLLLDATNKAERQAAFQLEETYQLLVIVKSF